MCAFKNIFNIHHYMTALMQSFVVNWNLLKHLDVKPTCFIPHATRSEDFLVYKSQKMLIDYIDQRQIFIDPYHTRLKKVSGAN